MSQNRKSNRKSSPAKRKSGGNTLVGIFIGLALGALIAAGAAWYIAKTNPFHAATQVAQRPVDDRVRPLPGKPGDAPVQSDYEFYRVLPEGTVPTPGAQPGRAPTSVPRTPTAPPDQVAVTGEALYLQVGAFANPDEAENLKVRLAFAGIQGNISQGLTANGRTTLYRVRVGPIYKPQDVSLVRSRLAEAGFNSTLTRADP